MGKASSAKKVARAARAGGRGARGGQRRSLLFPASVTIVCILGVSLILYARTLDKAEALEPGTNDHWHAAYGVDICGTLEAPFAGANNANGIHTHSDGAAHIEPGSAQRVAAAGDDATIGAFMESMGGELTDDSISFPGPDGETVTYTEGEDECDGEGGQVQVGYWANAVEADSTDPQVFTEDLADINFENDRPAFTVAFVPRGDDLLVPSTASTLDDIAGPAGADAATTTSQPAVSTTAPPGTTTSAPRGTSTTAPPPG